MSLISVSSFTLARIPATVLAVFLLASSISLSAEFESFVRQVVPFSGSELDSSFFSSIVSPF